MREHAECERHDAGEARHGHDDDGAEGDGDVLLDDAACDFADVAGGEEFFVLAQQGHCGSVAS